ncbi:MAG TPA: DUF1614 domain-containing protein [Mariprofundaceae bacterium]|nr:DUF1614 domain-containing protein [Mariprofundaceae bacterium]
MRSPFSPAHLLIFVLILVFLLTMVQLGLVSLAFDKLGLSTSQGMLLLFASLFGSLLNLPLTSIKAEPPPEPDAAHPLPQSVLRLPVLPFTGRTLIAVNAGGCLVPLVFSASLIRHFPLPLSDILLAVAIVAGICYATSRPIPQLGIGMPMLVAPIAAAIVAVLIGGEKLAAPLAYICGTLGVLVGADLLRLKDIAKIGAPIASIGGAGTFDGIFLTGIVAVLLT